MRESRSSPDHHSKRAISHIQLRPASGSLTTVKRRILFVFALCSAALAQDSSKKQSDQPPPPKKEEPAPLFGGKLGTRSSQKTKESATLGFNGIDPSGKVDQKMLSTSATSEHQAKVKKMADVAAKPAELDTFIKDGGLNKR